MKCKCAQTRPRFTLSSEGVFGGMEFELMLTPREKSPLPENFPREGSNPRRCGQRAQALPTELFRPPLNNDNNNNDNNCTERHDSRFYTISLLCHELSPTCTLKWPGHDIVQITCNTSGAHHMQHVACHMVQKDSSAIKFDILNRIYFSFILLADTGGEETGVSRETPW